MERSVKTVVEKNLCIGCGTCYSSCPLNAITMIKKEVFSPSIDARKCNNCGICEFVCPGYHIDYSRYQLLKNEENSKHHPLIGYYADVYLGHAQDHFTRFMGSSGGVITALLLYALKSKIIDGALVVTTTGMNPNIILAKSTPELKKAMGAKYVPVPLGVGLKEILGSDGHFAVVGLPCHLLGLHRISLRYPSLNKKVVLKLGLFCGRGFDFQYVNYVLSDLGTCPSCVREIRFRGYGWPGKTFIEYISENGIKETFLDYKKFGQYSGSYLFMPRRCVFCPDHTSEFADISFGDAWLEEIKKIDSKGTSIIISRNALGDKILRDAAKKGFIKISTSSLGSVIRSQDLQLNFHKISFKTRLRIAQILGMKTPSSNIQSIHIESFFMPWFALSVMITQIIYSLLKTYGLSQFLPKPIVRIWGTAQFLLNFTEWKLASHRTNAGKLIS